MRRRLALLVSVSLLTGGAVLTRPASAQVVLPGAAPLLLAGAVDVGPAPQQRRSVVLALALRDEQGLDRLLAAQQDPASPRYRRWLTPAQFAARFSPSAADVDRARTWAQAQGLRVDEVSPNRTLLTLSGPTARLGGAFDVHLRTVRAGSRTWVTPDRAGTVPQELGARAVLGLSTLPTFFRTAAPYRPLPTGYRPAELTTIYHAPAATLGKGQTAAVITQGDLTQVSRDLRTYQSRNRLPQVPLTVVQTTSPSTDTSGQDEYDLDTQTAFGLAPGLSRVIAYNAAQLGDVRPLNRFVVERRSLTASGSYGGCESLNSASGERQADDQVFRQAVAQGQTFWFASGDTGSSCPVGLPAGQQGELQDVNYPASSPYVVAVGGTTLTGASTQPSREVAWSGSGGGVSRTEPAPTWQRSQGQFDRSAGRGVPDVALDADPRSGYVVVVSGRDVVIGGTSGSAPAWNGVWARVLQRRRVGFAAPSLYAVNAFVDITRGDNGAFTAAPGYDLVTGLGSVDASALVSRVR